MSRGGGSSPSDSCSEIATTGSTADSTVDAADDETGDDHDGCPICKLLSMAQAGSELNAPLWAAAKGAGSNRLFLWAASGRATLFLPHSRAADGCSLA